MLQYKATPNVGIYVKTIVHHCVMGCCATATKGVIDVLFKCWFNKPFNPTIEGENHWALKRQDGSAAGVIFLILVIGSVCYIRACEGRCDNEFYGY